MSKTNFKNAIHSTLPLGMRKRLAVWIHNSGWIPRDRRMWWSQELVSDFADVDVNAYHKFLWAHHMAYAKTYDTATRFGENNLTASRKIYLEALAGVLRARGVDPAHDVESVFDVGCSLGYLLRHVETGLFTAARRLRGIDIDALAIAEGQQHLASLDSRVQIERADMEDLAAVLGAERYDVFFCTGVLMYLEQDKAAAVVKTILEHTNVVVGFAGLADPSVDNAELTRSGVRGEDGTFIHNIDAMVSAADGRVVERRWDGDRLVDDNSIYFVFAAPSS
jgi:2-polyprenyl-3-methyl-5-hydroxy-6-metoxy-1,4-benzoquinol methylase